MNIYLGGDWHFSKHKKSDGSFKVKEKESLEIIQYYKEDVKDDDIFIFLGDLSYFGEMNPPIINDCIKEIPKLPGKKIFIRGNNDMESDIFYKSLGFDYVGDVLRIGKFIFSHEPYAVRDSEINIHAHIHGADKYWNVNPKNHVDAYTPLFNNRPVEIHTLLKNGHRIEVKITEGDIYKLKQALKRL